MVVDSNETQCHSIHSHVRIYLDDLKRTPPHSCLIVDLISPVPMFPLQGIKIGTPPSISVRTILPPSISVRTMSRCLLLPSFAHKTIYHHFKSFATVIRQ